jgi:hypothetical protein
MEQHNRTNNFVLKKLCESRDFGEYAYTTIMITSTLINVLLWFYFHESVNIEGSPFALKANTVEFKYSLVIGICSSLIILFILLSDTICNGTFSLKDLKVKGSEYNFVNLTFLLVISLVLFYVAIPNEYYDLIYNFNVIRVIWMCCLSLSYLWKYGNDIWRSKWLLVSYGLISIGQTIRYTSVFANNKILNIIGFCLLFSATLIILYFTVKWCYFIRTMDLKQYTLQTYCCNIYLFFFAIYAVGNWVTTILTGFTIWYMVDTYSNYIYLHTTFIVGVTVLQSRAAVMDNAVSQVIILLMYSMLIFFLLVYPFYS